MNDDKPKETELWEASCRAATMLLSVMEAYVKAPGTASAKIVIEAGKVIADLHSAQRRKQ